MADVRKRVTTAGKTRWDVRYRDQSRRQYKRSFARKVDADRFARAVETDLLRGDWIDPHRGKEPFEVWAAKWVDTLGSRKPKTRESYESIVRKHLLPRFAFTPIAAIDYPCVLAFVSELQRAGAAAATVRNVRDVLRLVLGLAVRSGALKVNPVTDVEVGRKRRADMIFLEPESGTSRMPALVTVRTFPVRLLGTASDRRRAPRTARGGRHRRPAVRGFSARGSGHATEGDGSAEVVQGLNHLGAAAGSTVALIGGLIGWPGRRLVVNGGGPSRPVEPGGRCIVLDPRKSGVAWVELGTMLSRTSARYGGSRAARPPSSRRRQ